MQCILISKNVKFIKILCILNKFLRWLLNKCFLIMQKLWATKLLFSTFKWLNPENNFPTIFLYAYLPYALVQNIATLCSVTQFQEHTTRKFPALKSQGEASGRWACSLVRSLSPFLGNEVYFEHSLKPNWHAVVGFPWLCRCCRFLICLCAEASGVGLSDVFTRCSMRVFRVLFVRSCCCCLPGAQC
jgi:hypothetical protein